MKIRRRWKAEPAGVIGIHNWHWASTLRGYNRVQLPTLAQTVWPPEVRYFVRECRRKPVLRVEVRRSVLRLQVVGILRNRHRREIEINPVGGVIERLGEGVAAESGKPVPIARAYGSL